MGRGRARTARPAAPLGRHRARRGHLVRSGRRAGGPLIGRAFPDRRHAGRLLGEALSAYAVRSDLLVLALPRGGVPVGYEVATALGAPLDVYVVRKLGHPRQPELAIGAIAPGGVVVMNPTAAVGVDDEALEELIARESRELDRRLAAYRVGPSPIVEGRCVIVVDDGLATGASMRAALTAIAGQQPAWVVAAIPVAPRDAASGLADVAQEVVVLVRARQFGAVSQWYADFTATSDSEVRELLRQAAGRPVQRKEEGT
ncbi:MAG: phosphoribosyltransferase family protein [Actinomycetota bacterium]